MDNAYPPEAWKRLGEQLRQRRGELGYGFRQRGQFLADRGGPNPPSGKMLDRIENGARTYYPGPTVAALERMYGYEPGSFEAILQGGRPVPAAGTPGSAATAPVPVHEGQDPAPSTGSLAADAKLIFPDDPAAQTLLVRALDLGSLRELAGWITWQRKVAVEGFPEDRREQGATGLTTQSRAYRDACNCSLTCRLTVRHKSPNSRVGVHDGQVHREYNGETGTCRNAWGDVSPSSGPGD